jgi:hypothetical protein
MRPAAVSVAALLLVGAAAPNGHAQEATTVELSGATFRAIGVVMKELGRTMYVPVETGADSLNVTCAHFHK